MDYHNHRFCRFLSNGSLKTCWLLQLKVAVADSLVTKRLSSLESQGALSQPSGVGVICVRAQAKAAKAWVKGLLSMAVDMERRARPH